MRHAKEVKRLKIRNSKDIG